MSIRSRARELALKALYQNDITGESVEDVLATFQEDGDEPPGMREFFVAIVEGVSAGAAEIDRLISSHSEHWTIERMPIIDRNCIRMGTYELLSMPETPVPVILNETIKLGKKFGTEESGPFINGILDAIADAIPGRKGSGERNGR